MIIIKLFFTDMKNNALETMDCQQKYHKKTEKKFPEKG